MKQINLSKKSNFPHQVAEQFSTSCTKPPLKISANKTFHSIILNLGSKLYYMNKDGGLSAFDVKTRITKEIMDNTTFVSLCCHSMMISGFYLDYSTIHKKNLQKDKRPESIFNHVKT